MKKDSSGAAVLWGKSFRGIKYHRECKPEKCRVWERFLGCFEGAQRAASPLCRLKAAAPSDQGRSALGGYRAAAPVRSVEAASLYSGVQRWKTSAQGKLMPASTCTGYYLTQNSQDLRLRRPFPGPRTSSQEGGNLFETDTTQWALRQAWHL